ncbi:hypothetical protein TGGT1_410300 [Toxoplasma gondii GT1]|uniref:Uncharacterized protein n=1 Tax=Toxoplasma gondii (strain ATCC 50853 / GT1) TaxID=507601 RepID=S7UM85_TOXGG|nr:hypothetical protein TGGT1_410300 [Toxoplasma gondii GT1]
MEEQRERQSSSWEGERLERRNDQRGKILRLGRREETITNRGKEQRRREGVESSERPRKGEVPFATVFTKPDTRGPRFLLLSSLVSRDSKTLQPCFFPGACRGVRTPGTPGLHR